jgi:hypothetical protein
LACFLIWKGLHDVEWVFETFCSLLCFNGTLDPTKVAGKIVACLRGISARVEKGAVVLEAGGIGMILGNPPVSGNDIVADPHVLPATMVDANDAIEIFSYIADTRFKCSPYLQIFLQNHLHRKDTCEVRLVMDGLSQLFQLGTLACIVEIEISLCTIPITNQVINHGSYFENIESSYGSMRNLTNCLINYVHCNGGWAIVHQWHKSLQQSPFLA